MRSSPIDRYGYYQGKKRNYLQLIISVDSLELEKADEVVSKISDDLSKKLTKEWKCFPDKLLPECYNILTLPYGEFDLE